MRSKTFLFLIVLSSLFIALASININVYKLPIKASFASLTPEAKKQVTCLAENIYFEAGHEPFEGKKAVAFVTFNRLLTGNYADSICGVVQQKTNGTCQFSWYCDPTITSKRLTVRSTPLYNEILEMSTNLFLNFEKLRDVTNGATYYHADYVNPGWTRLKKEKQIGRHIFYKSKGDEIDRDKGIF